jgi:competence CoiA-like predicted nuclease
VPLKAIVEGEPVIGPDLSEEEWAALKQRHRKGLPVTMACCGAPGHLRSSKNGIQHFYHAAGAGCHYAEESLEHLAIKEQIYRSCRAAGWETTVEYSSPDRSWIADVYAARDGRKVVFEVQLSTISPDELEERDRKYRNAGIEPYWLLDNFLGRSKDFAAWYNAYLSRETGGSWEKIPYADPSLFDTGPENHLFIAKGIRSAGLWAKKQVLFTTGNPAIPLAVWVREVLNGNYQRYLEETAAACDRKRRLLAMAAPALIRFRDFYGKIIRNGTYRKKAGQYQRLSTADPVLRTNEAVQKKARELSSEVDWLEKEYRSFTADSSGLFVWKTMPGFAAPRLCFRFESEQNVKKLQECAGMFGRWEGAFEKAAGAIEKELSPGRTMK